VKRVLSALMLTAMASDASAQELPSSVSDAYLAYEAAAEQGEFAAASEAAEAAYNAARDAGLDEALLLTLGMNAISMAPARGHGDGLVTLVETVDALATRAGQPETVREAYLYGLAAAQEAQNSVAYFALRDQFLDILIEQPRLSPVDRVRLFTIEQPPGLADPIAMERRTRLEADRVALLAGNVDPVRLANLTLILRQDAVLREDRAAALAMTDDALVRIDPDTEPGQRSIAALVGGVPGLADILVADGQSMPDALATRAPETRDAMCAHLASRPVPMAPWTEFQIPLRSVERGVQNGVVRVEMTIRNDAFENLGDDPVQAPRSDYQVMRAIDRLLSRTEYHTDCHGEPVTMTSLVRVAYTGRASAVRRNARRIEFRIIQSIAPSAVAD